MCKTLIHQVIENARAWPNHPVVVDQGREYTFSDLIQVASGIADTFLAKGMRRSDRMALYAERSWPVVASLFAAWSIGATVIPINPILKTKQIIHILNDCHANFITMEGSINESLQSNTCAYPISITSDSLRIVGGFAESDKNVIVPKSSDVAAILYTSGSSGMAKGVILSHGNIASAARIIGSYLNNSPSDRILCTLPFASSYGLSQLTSGLYSGATAVLQRSMMPGNLLRSLVKHNITGLAGVPATWPILLKAIAHGSKYKTTNLRYITNSGASMNSVLLSELQRALPRVNIVLMYGSTETLRSTYLPPCEIHRGHRCIGKAIPEAEVLVINTEGKECPPGELGEIVHRGPTVAMGYLNDARTTSTAFREQLKLVESISANGQRWFFTGDIGRSDNDGFLYFVGRKDHQIKTRGYRVSPDEVEDILIDIPFIDEACVFGHPHPSLGEEIVATVVLSDRTIESREVIKQCLRRAPRYLVPETVVVVDAIPRTPSGKYDRQAIRHKLFSTGHLI